MTLNMHGEPSGRDLRTLPALTALLMRERPDAVALQEVNQSCRAEPLSGIPPFGYTEADGRIPLRSDNAALRLAGALNERGCPYFWSWLPVKRGYGKYDEGLALLTRGEIAETHALTVSRTDSYQSWRTRRLLGARVGRDWLYSVHYGWWDDPSEPFAEQWKRSLFGFHREGGALWLLGDFNNPAERRGQGYDLMTGSGFHDAWMLAGDPTPSATVTGETDGWRGLDGGVRIDLILCDAPIPECRAHRVLDGENGDAVSDHFGVMIEYEGRDEDV